MGKGRKGNKASAGSKDEFEPEAYTVGVSPEEDRNRAESEMGEDSRGAKEGSLKLRPHPAHFGGLS